jgi:hypothetical protein
VEAEVRARSAALYFRISRCFKLNAFEAALLFVVVDRYR